MGMRYPKSGTTLQQLFSSRSPVRTRKRGRCWPVADSDHIFSDPVTTLREISDVKHNKLSMSTLIIQLEAECPACDDITQNEGDGSYAGLLCDETLSSGGYVSLTLSHWDSLHSSIQGENKWMNLQSHRCTYISCLFKGGRTGVFPVLTLALCISSLGTLTSCSITETRRYQFPLHGQQRYY